MCADLTLWIALPNISFSWTSLTAIWLWQGGLWIWLTSCVSGQQSDLYDIQYEWSQVMSSYHIVLVSCCQSSVMSQHFWHFNSSLYSLKPSNHEILDFMFNGIETVFVLEYLLDAYMKTMKHFTNTRELTEMEGDTWFSIISCCGLWCWTMWITWVHVSQCRCSITTTPDWSCNTGADMRIGDLWTRPM